MGFFRSVSSALRVICLLILGLAVAPFARSQAVTVDLSGSYECTGAKIAGRVVACAAAPLILKSDGRFELRGWEGSYLVEGEWVELSDSLTKARAKIEPGHKIVLRYFSKRGWEEMTYERRVAELGKVSLS